MEEVARHLGYDRIPVVVGVHGFKGFRNWGFWPHIADGLAERGFVMRRRGGAA